MNPTLQSRTTMSGTIGLGLRTFLFSERPELRKRRVCFAHGTRKCTDRQLGTRQLPLRLFRQRGLRSKLGTHTMIDRDDGLRTFLFSERPELRKRRVFSHGTRSAQTGGWEHDSYP